MSMFGCIFEIGTIDSSVMLPRKKGARPTLSLMKPRLLMRAIVDSFAMPGIAIPTGGKGNTEPLGSLAMVRKGWEPTGQTMVRSLIAAATWTWKYSLKNT